jgi:hypothetical protein
MSKRWSAAALVVFVLAIMGVAQTSVGHAALRSAGLSSGPPSYVALSFADLSQLPSQLFSQEALLNASFTLNNHSTTQREFSWTISDVQHGRTIRLAAGQTAVSYRASATVNRLVMTSCVGGQLKLVVQLAAPRESISFVAACWPGGVLP